jgi:hypothetical protein
MTGRGRVPDAASPSAMWRHRPSAAARECQLSGASNALKTSTSLKILLKY